MSSKKCLIIDPMHESIFSMLHEIGWEGIYKPNVTRDEIREQVNQYDGLIVRSKTRIDRDLLGNFPLIRLVGRAGAGLDNVDVDFLNSKNIAVVHAAEGNRDAVGEHTLGLILNLFRNISIADQQVRSSLWKREENRGVELMGKTVGIIGYGNMGQAFARRLAGFECKVLAYDKYKTGFSDSFCKEVSLQTIFQEADVLSLHIPLTAETKMMVNTEFVESFNKNIVLINTSRGEIVSLSQLSALVRKGKIRGAALDVLENENLQTLTPIQQTSFNYLSGQTNVIFTPHIAGWTFESHIKINVALVQKIKDLNI